MNAEINPLNPAGSTVPMEFLAFTLGQEEYGIDIQKVQELRGYVYSYFHAFQWRDAMAGWALRRISDQHFEYGFDAEQSHATAKDMIARIWQLGISLELACANWWPVCEWISPVAGNEINKLVTVNLGK